MNARETAINILVSVLNGGSYSNISVHKELSAGNLSMPDKSLATALVYGVLDRKITLDYIISQYVKMRVEKIKPITANALRIALYQILFMDKIPDSAAVNESVNIVKKSKERFNASFVNGVLRSYLREPVGLPLGKSAEDLSIIYSCPIWIVESFISDYGFDACAALLNEAVKKPPIYLRVNTLKTDSQGLIEALKEENITAVKCDTENALTVNSAIDIVNTKPYTDGLFHVEDLASQKMIENIGFKENMRILDICSAPGGKAFTMAQYLKNNGEIIACDLYEHRVNLIKRGAARLGLTAVKPLICDATVFNEDLGEFDAVLCDVPCSGLGVIRRKPEIKYKKIDSKDYENLIITQQTILENADKYLKPGGKLIYSTCTLKKAENSGQISDFLDKHRNYDVKYNVNYMPHIDGTDGFYYAVLYKKR